MLPVLPALLLTLLAPAQDADAPVQRNTALVRQHPHLDQLVTRAGALTSEGRYREALEIYVKAAAEYPNHLVPVDQGYGAAPALYVGVQEYGRRQIARWPEEGKTAYRATFDGFARAEFESARRLQDLRALAELAERYPFSSFADDALALLGNLALDAGDFAAAADALERAAAMGDSDVPRAPTLARLGVALARSGRRAGLETLAARVERESAEARILLGDREARLSDFLRALLGQTGSAPAAEEPRGWECYQGDPSGTRIVEGTMPATRAWTAPVEAAQVGLDDEEYGFGGARQRLPHDFRPYAPAIADGIVYLHNEYAAWAWNLYATASDPLWEFRVPVPAGTLLFEERLVHATTVADGRVFVNLIAAHGRMETRMQYIHVKFPFPKRALFALDAQTGKLLWRVGGEPESRDFFASLSFPMAPTAWDGRLFVGAVRQPTNTDPFEHYLLCLDAATGLVLWHTFVASGGTEINLFGNSTRESVGMPASIAGGSVYYGTNHGAFAAVDARTGRLQWLFRYQQLPVNPTRSVSIRRNPLEWAPNAPVASEDLVFFAATDARTLYALDARSGEKKWERPRGDLRYLYGLSGEYLVAGGASLEWYDRKGHLQGRYEPERGRGSGRGLLLGSAVCFPTTEGFYRIDLAERTPRPEFQRWPGGGSGGLMAGADGAVVVAGSASLEVFYDRRDREKEVREMVEGDPRSAAVAYRGALLMLQSGRAEQAIELLARVVESTKRSAREEDQRLGRAARRRLYAVALREGRKAGEAGEAARARRHFEIAREAAPGLAETLEATLRLGETLRASGDPSAAVAEVQDLIFRHGPEIVGGQPVWETARAAIAGILSGAPTAYARFETQAGGLLERAKEVGTPEALLEVWKRFPNSAAAEAAVVEAARRHAGAGRHDEAASTLRLFLRHFPASPRAVEVQVALIRELEHLRQYASAAHGVRRLLRSAPDAATREFCESRLALEEYKGVSTDARPVKLRPPLSPAGAYVEREAAPGMFVLRPHGPPLARARGLVLIVAGATLKGVRPSSGAAEWRVALDSPVRAAFAADEGLVLCLERTILRIQPGTGAVEWRHPVPSALRQAALSGSILCYTAPSDRAGQSSLLVALDASRGSILWSQEFAGSATAGGLAGLDERVALTTSGPHRLLVFAVDTGRREMDERLPVEGGGARILATEEALVLVAHERLAVEAWDVRGRRLAWRRDLRHFENAVIRHHPAGGLLVAGRSRGVTAVSLIDPRTGKLLKIADRNESDEIRQAVLDGSRAFLLLRSPDLSSSKVRALSLKDFEVEWEVAMDGPSPAGGDQIALREAEEHLVAFRVWRREDGRFDFEAALLDHGGRTVQNIRGDGRSERQVGFELADDALLVLTDNRVEVHR